MRIFLLTTNNTTSTASIARIKNVQILRIRRKLIERNWGLGFKPYRIYGSNGSSYDFFSLERKKGWYSGIFKSP